MTAAEPTTTFPAAPGPVTRAARAVSAKIAALIGVAAFLVGLGVSMLVGPLGDPPDGPGGTPPEASTSQGTGT
ncbi:hypothetical protein ACFPK1_06725 [Actinomycetospora rhizophila]|uniref:Uncharacterized protein n=1 Tax=Actinomycetospora rhizophila TaxID=1416876 RepID=A0ABV9Z8I4_9PSEU